MKKLFLIGLLATTLDLMAACPAVVPQVQHKILTFNSATNSCGTLSTGTTAANAETNRALIQEAINNVAQYQNGGVVVVPAGTFYVGMIAGSSTGIYLELKSKVTLRMEPTTILRAYQTTSNTYRVINIGEISNAGIYGGTIIGDRDPARHVRAIPPAYNDNGNGLYIFNSSHISIQNVVIKDMWGDAIYMGHWSGSTQPTNNDILVHAIIASNNSRNAISVVRGDGVIISNSILRKTNGTDPGAGIDIEPNPGTTDYVKNITIFDNKIGNFNDAGTISTAVGFEANNGAGILMGTPGGANQANFQNIAVINNLINANKKGGIAINEVANVKVLLNKVNSNLGDGILIQDGGTAASSEATTSNMIAGNTSNTNTSYGVALDEVQNNFVWNNIATTNTSGAVWAGSYKNLYCKNGWQAASPICAVLP